MMRSRSIQSPPDLPPVPTSTISACGYCRRNPPGSGNGHRFKSRASPAMRPRALCVRQQDVWLLRRSPASVGRDGSAIDYTRDYLNALRPAYPAQNAADLIATMPKAHPKSGSGVALDISARVSKGEMKW